MDPTVIVALIGFSGVLVTTVFGWLPTYKELVQEREDRDTERHSVNVMNSINTLANVNLVHNAVERLFKETRADRFLILTAMNGKKDMRSVSAIYEQHDRNDIGMSAVSRYHKLEVDQEYHQMLKSAEQIGPVVLDVAGSMQDSLLKNIYISEGVKHSVITFLYRVSLDENNDIMVYSSIATHSEEHFTMEELLTISLEYQSSIRPMLKEVLEAAAHVPKTEYPRRKWKASIFKMFKGGYDA